MRVRFGRMSICLMAILPLTGFQYERLPERPTGPGVESGRSRTDSRLLPPNVLYHFGRRAHLVEDAKAGTLAREVWDKYIMGDSTTFRSHPFRRGLYGTVHPAFADTFGDWFIAVHVKNECRTPEAVVIPSQMYLDPRLAGWYAAPQTLPIATVDQFTTQCFRDASPKEGAQDRLLLNVQNVVKEIDGSEGACETVLEQFYRDTDAKIILDEQWMEQEFIGVNLINRVSWYIRNRDCIQDIEGQERDVVHMFAEVDDLWDDQEVLRISADEGELVESSKAIQRADAVRMLMIGLSEFPESASDDDLWKIRSDAEEGHSRLWPLSDAAVSLVPPLVDAFTRCRRASSIEDFRGEVPIGDFDLELIPGVVERLKLICVGGM